MQMKDFFYYIRGLLIYTAFLGRVKVTNIFCSFYLWSTVLNKVPALAELPASLYFQRNNKRANQPMPRGWLIFKLFRGNCP